MNIDIKDHVEFSRFLKQGIEKSLHNALMSTATRMVSAINTEIIPRIRPYPPVDRGLFRGGFRVKSLTKAKVLILNAVPHAPFVEYGVRAENIKPGRAMITALTAWVRRKGIGAKSSSIIRKGTPNQRLNKPDIATATGIAWAIATKMKKKGIFNGAAQDGGMQVLKKAVEKFDVYFREEIAYELDKIS